MKHLRRFNEANDEFSDLTIIPDIINDLGDMLLDIIDMGFWTDVKANNYVITVTISRLRNSKGFIRSDEEFNSIKDVLQRLKDYAGVNRLNIDNTWLDRLNSSDIETFNRYIHQVNNADVNRCSMYITLYPMKGRSK